MNSIEQDIAALTAPGSLDAATRTRRDFLRSAGLAGAVFALAGCGATATELTAPSEPIQGTPSGAVVGPGGAITLNFASDIDVLNYAYALEQLEAGFYDTAVKNSAFSTIFAANEQRVLMDIRDHEVVHRDFFAAALGAAKIPNLTPDFSTINFGNRASVLGTAKVFEDLGVSAYNGAARYLASAAYLGLAGKIVSVEARHASTIRDLLNNRSGDFAPNAFDAGATPQAVLTAAHPFIVETITVINA